MSDMTHKMWSQWKDFRLNEKKGDHEGQMAKSQLKLPANLYLLREIKRLPL